MFAIVLPFLKELLIFLTVLIIKVLSRMGSSPVLSRFPAGTCRGRRDEVKAIKYLPMVLVF